MNQPFIKAGISACLLSLVLSGCVDNDYDLSNIDTTTEIKVKDLVLPVNIQAVTLNDIIDVDQDSKIKTVEIDGKEFYAVTESGSISSDGITVDGFTAPAPTVNTAYARYRLDTPATRGVTLENYYELSSFSAQTVEFRAENIDSSIKSLSSIDMQPLHIDLTMTTNGFGDETVISFAVLELQFLKGLTFESLPAGYQYNASTGVLKIENLPCPNHKADINLVATAIDFTASGTDIAGNSLDFKSEVKPISGRVKTVSTFETGTTPSVSNEIEFIVNTTAEAMTATYVTGDIEYHLEGDGLNINPVDLSDIPDFLNESGTDLRLANPQIYLNLSNPVAADGLYYQTGLELGAVRNGSIKYYELDNDGVVRVEKTSAGPFNFVLSPSMPTEPLKDYASGLKHVPFTGLSDVLSGEGLPSSIEINLINPELPSQHMEHFELNKTIPGVTGSYEFFAPLALKDGSVIIYSDRIDGWNDEDVDKIIIETLEIEADVTSTIPLGAKLTAWPIDKDGHRIGDVHIEGADIEALAKGKHINIRATGEIRHLDGITFDAVVRPGSEETLSPNQTISLENIKAKVSGSYTTDF